MKLRKPTCPFAKGASLETLVTSPSLLKRGSLETLIGSAPRTFCGDHSPISRIARHCTLRSNHDISYSMARIRIAFLLVLAFQFALPSVAGQNVTFGIKTGVPLARPFALGNASFAPDEQNRQKL